MKTLLLPDLSNLSFSDSTDVGAERGAPQRQRVSPYNRGKGSSAPRTAKSEQEKEQDRERLASADAFITTYANLFPVWAAARASNESSSENVLNDLRLQFREDVMDVINADKYDLQEQLYAHLESARITSVSGLVAAMLEQGLDLDDSYVRGTTFSFLSSFCKSWNDVLSNRLEAEQQQRDSLWSGILTSSSPYEGMLLNQQQQVRNAAKMKCVADWAQSAYFKTLCSDNRTEATTAALSEKLKKARMQFEGNVSGVFVHFALDRSAENRTLASPSLFAPLGTDWIPFNEVDEGGGADVNYEYASFICNGIASNQPKVSYEKEGITVHKMTGHGWTLSDGVATELADHAFSHDANTMNDEPLNESRRQWKQYMLNMYDASQMWEKQADRKSVV